MIKSFFYKFCTVLLNLISLLPLWFLFLIADGLCFFLYYVVHYRTKVVRQNLQNSFPEKSTKELRDIERKFFRYLADFIKETVKSISISEKELKKRVVLTNPEMVSDYYAQGRSIIAVGSHYCNWELAGMNFYFYTDKKFMIVYKPLSNAIFDKFFYKIRSRFGTIPVSMRQTFRKVIEFKNEKTATALLGDQTPALNDATYFTEFLNQPTAVFLGIEKLAKSMNSVVLYYDMKRIKRGYYSYTLISLFENPKQTEEYEITKAHVNYLESVIKREPQYWLWSHRRWKLKPEDIQK
jgi:KDO2-lipid IV(A) lauroyltransferase